MIEYNEFPIYIRRESWETIKDIEPGDKVFYCGTWKVVKSVKREGNHDTKLVFRKDLDE